MNSGVIFDLDGTLVDSLPGIAASLNRTLAQHGFPGHPDLTVRTFIGDGLRTLIQRAAPAGSSPALIDSLLATYIPDYSATWREGTRLFPGIENALSELTATGTPLAILSNKVHKFTVEIVRELLPEIPFACVLGLRDGMAPKPDPAGAREIADRLGLPTASCLLIGDSTMDLEVAAHAGMRCLAVTWGYHDRSQLHAAGAKHWIETPAELVPTIHAVSRGFAVSH